MDSGRRPFMVDVNEETKCVNIFGRTENEGILIRNNKVAWLDPRFYLSMHLHTVKNYESILVGENDHLAYGQGTGAKIEEEIIHIPVFDDSGLAISRRRIKIRFPTEGNSILIQTKGRDYIFVGPFIASLKVQPKDQASFASLQSPIGENGEVYPFAVGFQNTYLFYEKCFIPNTMIDKTMFDENERRSSFERRVYMGPYEQLYFMNEDPSVLNINPQQRNKPSTISKISGWKYIVGRWNP